MTIFFKRVGYFLGLVICASMMSACTTSGPSAPIQTMKEIIHTVWPGEPQALKIKTRYQYLHAQLGSKMAILILGSIEKTPEGPVQVWYGADGLTLKINEQGRLLGVWGLAIEWSSVDFYYPINIPQLKQVQTFTRVRDEMPGHYVGMKELVTIKPLLEIPSVVRKDFRRKNVQWYDEQTQARGVSRGKILQAYYGWYQRNSRAQPEWIYGYQCLSEDICLTWFKEPKEVFQ